MIVDRRYALHRSTGNTAVADSLCRERRFGRAGARVPLSVRGFDGQALDAHDLQGIKESVLAALALGDHGHIELVMADLRVKEPKSWVEVDRLLGTLRAFKQISPREPLVGLGSAKQRPAKIERNLHRFWAGMPMREQTVASLLAMQDVVVRSADSGTPWTQYLWTSGVVNDHVLDDQLAKLAAAGIEIVDMDAQWAWLSNLAYVEKGMRWTKEAKADLDRDAFHKLKWLSDLVRLVAVRTHGGVYLDADIGPGTLTLSNHQLYHTDPDGEIGHHAPPFRVPRDYREAAGDATLGDTPRERIVRHADASLPLSNAFLASRSRTEHLDRALATLFERESLSSGMGVFGPLFIPLTHSLHTKPAPYAPPRQRVTPWAADLAWMQGLG